MLIWSRKRPKFNLHHLRKIFLWFKMSVLTPKSGILLYSLYNLLGVSESLPEQVSKGYPTLVWKIDK